jgi:DNA-binding beta-propeller fold protein YncE
LARLHSRHGSRRRGYPWLGAATVAAVFAAAAPAHAAPFVYVTNPGSAGISQYNAGAGGLLAPLSPATVAGPSPGDPAVSPNGRNLYVTNGSDDTVSQYDVGADGKLSPKSPATVATEHGASGVAVSPKGASVYVANFFGGCCGGTVSQYDVGAGGRLSPKSPPTVFADQDPFAVAVSPDGGSVYVTNFHLQENGSISQFDLGPGGKLSPKSPAAVGTGQDPSGLAVSPDGDSVYVANNSSNTISQYNVGAGGKLSPKSPATVTDNQSPFRVAVSPDGKSVYATNFPRGSGSPTTVSQFNVGAGGTLSPKSPATVGAGIGPEGVAVSPNGGSVYVANNLSNTISQYNVGAGGKLSPKSPATVGAGGDPRGIAVTPPIPGWEGFVTNPASGCKARVQIPYLDGNLQVTAYTEVSCPRETQLTIRSRLRSDYYPLADITVAQKGCLKGCVVTVPKGNRFFRLTCPKSSDRRNNQPYYSDIIFYPGTNSGAATKERSRDKSLSPFCAH